MNIILEEPPSPIKRVLAILIFIGIITASSSLGLLIKAKTKIVFSNPKVSEKNTFSGLSIIQGNSLLAMSSSIVPNENKKVKKIKMIITAYSSDPYQTDDTPFITASGDMVRYGIVANNLLPFGTKIKIPELYGNKVFVVQDRMNRKKSYYQIDIWLPENWQAKKFGVKKTYVEILES